MANRQVSGRPKQKVLFSSRIIVTHYINPHLFWYYKWGKPNSLHKVLAIENVLPKACNGNSGKRTFRPSLNEIVAAQYLPFSKYIRGKILHVDEGGENPIYILWATDYGFPFASAEKYLWQLPIGLRKTIGRIKCGGIANIYPKTYVPMTDEMKLHDAINEISWSNDACEFIELLMNNARSLVFYQAFLSQYKKQWGFLKIKSSNGSVYKASELLNKYGLSIGAEGDFKFNSEVLHFLNQCPWLSNNGKIIYRLNKLESIPQCINFQNCLFNNNETSTKISSKLVKIFDELKEKHNGVSNDDNIGNKMTENKAAEASVQKFRDLRSRLRFSLNDDFSSYNICRKNNNNVGNLNETKTQVVDEKKAKSVHKFKNIKAFNRSEGNVSTNAADKSRQAGPARSVSFRNRKI